MINFFPPAIDHFSASQTCFLQIPAHCMYLSFGPHLSRLTYATAPFGPLVVQQLLMKLSCVEDSEAPSESLWTLQLQLAKGGFSNPHETDQTVYKLSALCLAFTPPLACPSAYSRLPSLIQMFLMQARKPKTIKSLSSPGIRRPILKAIGKGTASGGHGGFGF